MIWLLIDSSSVGGAERHVTLLAEALCRRGIETTIVLYADHGRNPWLEQIHALGLPAQILKGSFADLLRQLKLQRPSLLHTHGYKAGILGRIAARLTGIPVVSTFHSGMRGAGRVNFYDWLDEWTSILAIRIAVSEAVRKRLPFNATCIPSFVWVPDGPTPGPLPRRVGFVGRLTEEKRPDLFCRLAETAPPGVEWHVFGDGPLRRELEQAHGHTVTFHGIKTDLSPVWPSLGLLVMPSRSEGIPLSALEALAQGIPVLASRVGGLPEIVVNGRTGWLFEEGNLQDAGEGLQRWLNCDAREQADLRTNCWSHVREYFSEESVVSRVLGVYETAGLIAQQAPRQPT